MVFMTIMTRGAARFFMFFRKNLQRALQNVSYSPSFVTPRKWEGG